MLRLVPILALVALAPSSLNPYLISDINPQVTGVGSEPRFFTAIGSLSFFSAATAETGRELWVTDGTPEGTRMVIETLPGSIGSILSRAGTIGNSLLMALAEPNGAAVYATDGTAEGTRRLITVNSFATAAGSLGGFAYFVSSTSATGTELFRTNGTAAGTSVIDLNPGAVSSSPVFAGVINNALYFFATTPAGTGLHRSNGTANGTTLIAEGAAPLQVAQVGQRLVFVRRDTQRTQMEVSVSDGTPGGTTLVMTVPNPRADDPILGVVGNTAFIAGSTISGPVTELIVTDGTVGGTRVITTVDGFVIGRGATTDNLIYFLSFTSDTRWLWRSDGTAAGTFKVRTDRVTNSSTVVTVGNVAYFASVETGFGIELWRTDGTVEGTRMVSDLTPGSASSLDTLFGMPHNGQLLFRAEQPEIGFELFITDGTAEGTRLIRNIREDLGTSSQPRDLRTSGERLFTIATDTQGTALWSRPPAGDAYRVTAVNHSATVNSAVASGGLYYFTQGELPAMELWRSDGTAAGTFLLHKLSTSRYFGPFVPYRNGILFGGNTGGLWFSDGTVAGTREIPGVPAGNILVASDGWVYTSGGGAIWRTNLTQSIRIADTLEGESLQNISSIAELNGKIYFLHRVHDGLFKLAETDGTLAGTKRVVAYNESPAFDLFSSGTRLFFLIPARGIFTTDGTAEGTVRVDDNGAPFSFFHDPRSIVAMNGVLYWNTAYGASTAGLWRSDGTPEGTYRITSTAPVNACGGSTDSPDLIAAGGRLWFAGKDDAHGVELWSSDGTLEGTRIAADIEPGPKSSTPCAFAATPSYVYVSATTEETGRELFGYRFKAPKQRSVTRR